MEVYVFDVGKIKPCLDPEMEAKADLLQYFSHLIRGCTDNYSVIKLYHEFWKELIGEYVELLVFNYNMPDVTMDKNSDQYEEMLSEIALTQYLEERSSFNDDVEGFTGTSHIMPVIHKYNLENGGFFATTQSMEDAICATNCNEKEILLSILNLFTKLNKYIYPMQRDQLLMTFRERLLNMLPRIAIDYYDPRSPLMMDIQYIVKKDVTEFKFCN